MLRKLLTCLGLGTGDQAYDAASALESARRSFHAAQEEALLSQHRLQFAEALMNMAAARCAEVDNTAVPMRAKPARAI